MQRQIETAIAQINNAWSICVAIIYEPSRSLLVKPQYVFNLNYHQSASAVQKGSAAAAMRCVCCCCRRAREREYIYTYEKRSAIKIITHKPRDAYRRGLIRAKLEAHFDLI
jgi:hypothetical protein